MSGEHAIEAVSEALSPDGLLLVEDAGHLRYANTDARELLRRVTQDDLTQVANRRFFVERVEHEIRRGDRHGHALMVLDLDGFKQVNDGFGHEVGDRVLVEVADRLRASCRPQDLVARLGGDEFALWCPGLCDSADVTAFAQRLIDSVERPISIASSVAVVGVSVGVVMTTDSSIDITDMLVKADAAMYRSKAQGSTRWVIYDDDLGRDLVRARSLDRSLADAIANDRLQLHYHTTIDLESGSAVSIEALIRWAHPQLGLVTPRELLEVASRTHLHASMTSWIVRSSLQELADWNRVLTDPIGLSVNVAASQLTAGLVELIIEQLNRHRIESNLLTVEITEDTVSSRRLEAVDLLHELHDSGVRVAIDDFGTGESSLHALQHLPLDVLKIDPVFVQGMAGSKRQAAMVEAIVGLGRALDLEVVAEGIETESDLRAARDLGCDLAQGFLFSHPAPAFSIDLLQPRI